MKKKVKIIGVIVIVLILAAVGAYTYMQPLAVETKTMELSESSVTFTEAGSVVNQLEQSVYPEIGGKVAEIKVFEGDSVKKGDILAVLDYEAVDLTITSLEKTKAGYEAQLMSAELENQSSIDTLESNRNNLYGQLKALEADEKTESQEELEAFVIGESLRVYEQGVEDLAKYKELLDNGYITDGEYKDIETLVGAYEADYKQALVAAESREDYYTGMKASLYAQINSINKTLEKDFLPSTKAYYQSLIDGTDISIETAKLQKEQHFIKAGVDGKVDKVYIDKVNFVSGMEPAFLIQGDGNLEIEVKVNIRDIDIVSVGDTVELKLDRRSGDLELSGVITKVSDSATIEISPLGIEERKVLVTVAPDSEDELGSGYEVDVDFTVFEDGDNIIVPNSALYKKDGKDMIMIIEGGRSKEVEVILGYELTGETIITSGISVGDMVIVDLDAKGLRVGANVTSSNE